MSDDDARKLIAAAEAVLRTNDRGGVEWACLRSALATAKKQRAAGRPDVEALVARCAERTKADPGHLHEGYGICAPCLAEALGEAAKERSGACDQGALDVLREAVGAALSWLCSNAEEMVYCGLCVSAILVSSGRLTPKAAAVLEAARTCGPELESAAASAGSRSLRGLYEAVRAWLAEREGR